MQPAGLRPLRVGEVLDVAIKIYRSQFATLVKAVALVVAPVQVLTALVQASAPEQPATVTDPGTPQPGVDFSGFWGWLAALLVTSLLALIAGQLATAASLKAVSGGYLGEKPQWRESLRFAFARLGSLVWLALLSGILLFLAVLAFVVPAIYFYGAWAVAVPVLLLEDVRGRRALKRSRSLVQGRWWPTVGAILVGVLLAAVVQFAFGFVAGLGVALADTDNDVVFVTLQAVSGAASGILVTPFTAAVTAVVYFDLRVRKEGLDLELLAQRVGVEPPAGGRAGLLPPPPGGWAPAPPPGREQPPPGWPAQPPPSQPPRA